MEIQQLRGRERGGGGGKEEVRKTNKRPGSGISPDEIQYVLGRRLTDDIEEDRLIRWEDLQ